MKAIPLKKIGIVLASILLLIALFIASLAFFLPVLVSSERVRKEIETRAAAALGTEIHIGEISWSWREGVLLKEIRVKDHPDFSHQEILSLNQAHLQLYPMDLFKKRVRGELVISGLSLNIIKSEEGLLNINRLLSGKAGKPEALPGEESPSPHGKSPVLPAIVLPMDLSLNIALTKTKASYSDLGTKKSLSVDDLAFHLNIPSLRKEPSRLLLSLDLLINGAPFPDQRLGLIIHPPKDSGREVDMAAMSIDMEGLFPGITLSGKGNPLKEGFKGDIAVDLPTIQTLLTPFLQETVKELSLAGTLSFKYDIKSDPSFESFIFTTALDLKEGVVGGGPISGGLLGPFSLSLKNQGEYHLKGGDLSLRSGDISLLSHSRLSYRFDLRDGSGPDPLIDLKIEPLHVDLKELYEFLTPILPDDLKTNPPVTFNELSLDAGQISFKGKMGEKPEIFIGEARLSSPAIQGNQPSAPFLVHDFSVSIPKGTVILKERFPETAFVSLGVAFSRVVLSLEKPVVVEAFSLSGVDLAASGLSPDPASPLGIRGEFHVKNRLSADTIDVQKTILLKAFSQTSDLVCKIAEAPLIRVAVNEFTAAVEQLRPGLPGKDSLHTGASLALSIPEAAVTQLVPFQMDISNGELRLDLDDALTVSARAGLEDFGKTRMETSGRIWADLSQMSKKVNPTLLKGILLSGGVSIDWGLSGRMFSDKEREGILERPYAIKENLSFIDQASVSIGLSEMGVDMGLPEKERIQVRSITTGAPLTYLYDGKNGSGRLSGRFLVKEILSLPKDPFRKPLSFTFEVNGGNQGAESVTLSQKMVVTPLNIRESFTLELMGLDKLLASGMHTPFSDILTHMEGEMAFSVVPSGKADFSAVKGVPSFSGELSIGATARLIPKKSVALSLSADLLGVTARDPGFYSLENMNADIRFDKTWGILWEKSDPEVLKHHLSVQVMDPGMDTSSRNAELSDKMAGFLDTMKTGLKPGRTLSFSRFQMEKGAFPFTASGMELDLFFNDGTPAIPYFKIDALGGTLLASASASRKREVVLLNAAVAFSGIDTRKFFMEKNDARENPETEVSGKAALTLPLVSDMTLLTAGLKMDLFFSHIGKKALEKMLYALDPTESNEQIVAQRKLLRKGTPKWIRLLVEDGALSLTGKILIFNMEEDIPPIERLNISNLSILKAHDQELQGIASAADILNKLSASYIDITRKESATLAH